MDFLLLEQIREDYFIESTGNAYYFTFDFDFLIESLNLFRSLVISKESGDAPSIDGAFLIFFLIDVLISGRL